MIAPDLSQPATSTVDQVRNGRITLGVGYSTTLAVAMMLGLAAWHTAPGGFSLGMALLILTIAAWIVRPRLGLHLTVAFALLGDFVTAPWFPFTKNLSSRESLLYVADSLTVSPLELTLAVAVVALILRRIATRQRLVTGPLWRPLIAFTVFVIVGFLYGLGRGGDLRIAVFEGRALFYIPALHLLVSNTCRTPQQYRRVLWTAAIAVFGQSLMSLYHYAQLSAQARHDLQSLGEHGSAVGFDLVIVLLISVALFKGSAARAKIGLVLMSVPVAWAYLVAQRRSAVIGLFIALVLISAVLVWRRRVLFWIVVPVATLLITLYVGAFWKSETNLGFPAQAVKSVVAPGSVSKRDVSSDLYRKIENFDLNYTIRHNKVLGIGFGQPFYQPVPLPDISFFAFHAYLPHNSILWIWLKTGFAGFATIVFILGRALMLAADKLRRLVYGPDIAIVATAAAFIIMLAVFSYVDIGWDARNMVILGAALAICGNFPETHVVADVVRELRNDA